METFEKLNKIAEFQAQRTLLEVDKQKTVDSVLTPEIKKALADIDAEFAPKYAGLDENINALTGEVKTDVLAKGETVKGLSIMAVFTKGRVSWDTKALDGYAAGHPEIAQFRKEGDPSVSIRKA
jgi:phage host-nuclease inhibitor protein Gam